MEKKFKCKDEVIYRDKNGDCEWTYGIFSHYHKANNKAVAVINGDYLSLFIYDILPYEGNEHLVGTDLPADEEVRLEEGELIVCSDDIERLKTGHGVIEDFVETASNEFHIKQGGFYYNFCIRFSDFNPNDMEETKKHILCVKNGKIIRYKD